MSMPPSSARRADRIRQLREAHRDNRPGAPRTLVIRYVGSEVFAVADGVEVG